MKWYLRIFMWVADAIRTKAESNEDNNVDARLGRIEKKLKGIEKTNIPVALFASGIPIYLIGFANSLKNALEGTTFEWDNLVYLIVGSLLVTFAMKRYSGKNRDSYITIAITFGILICISIFNYIKYLA